jgi:hypothetical protein
MKRTYGEQITAGLAIAQALSWDLLTVVAWAQSEVMLCGICSGQSGTVAGSLWELQFPLPNLIPPIDPDLLIILSSISYSLDTDSIVKWPI